VRTIENGQMLLKVTDTDKKVTMIRYFSKSKGRNKKTPSLNIIYFTFAKLIMEYSFSFVTSFTTSIQ
jgi:hypothetical protein